MNEPESIRLILVDDHSTVHRGIAAIIEVFDDLELVAQGSNGKEAVQLCDEYQPDIVLMDVIMPVMNGIEATKAIHGKYPDIKILALSSFQDQDSVRAMIDAGAIGYVLKNSSIDDLAHTIRAAHSGKSVFSSEVAQGLFQPRQAAKSSQDYGLTRREIEILRLMVEGMNNTEIAGELTISVSTVKFHVSSVLGKLNAANRVEAVALAVEQNLVN